MVNKLKYPLYEISLEGEDALGMFAISLVDKPATKSEWLAFADEERMEFEVVSEDERKLMGVIMRAEFPILRRDEDGNYFYVVFKKDVIETLAQRFLRSGFSANIDINHDFKYDVDGVVLEQIFIKDTAKGINPYPEKFGAIEEGSLFGIYKIENDEVWEAVKKGLFKGFSLEGLFERKKISDAASNVEELLKQKD